MVRTKTRARTLAERFPPDKYPNGPPTYSLPPKSIIVSNNAMFNDHTGNQALMSWESPAVKHPLPPLASWIFYMVHPDVPRDFDGVAFFDGIEDGNRLYRGGHFRYEYFFLPGATAEECHAHYLEEMKARGTIWRQIRKVKKAMDIKNAEAGEQVDNHSDQESSPDPELSADSKLPGLVWPDEDVDSSSLCWRGWFFIYPDSDLECRGTKGLERDIDLVRFDPVLEGWGEEDFERFDPREHPVYSERKKARHLGFEEGLLDWIGLAKCSYWERMADEATGQARKLGWESW